MAGRKDTSKTGRKANGHSPRKTEAGALTRAPAARRSEGNGGARRVRPTADELGLRAWKTTYEKSREGRAKD
jgi:hypothetical protein